MLATSLAVRTGCLIGAHKIAVPKIIRSVTEAAAASVIKGSCQATEYTFGATSR